MNIIKDFIPFNKYSRCGTPLKKVTGIVIHWVNNPGTSAYQNVKYFHNLAKQNPDDDPIPRFASTPFVVDNNQIIQAMPENEIAYHCGAYRYKKGIKDKIGRYPNAHTIGIEVCHPDKSGKFSSNTVKNLAKLVAYLMLKYSLKAEHIYRHWDITGKMCPLYYVNNEIEWSRLKDLFKVQLFELNKKHGLEDSNG